MKYTVKKVTMYRVFCPYCRDRFTYDTELDARVEVVKHMKVCTSDPNAPTCNSCIHHYRRNGTCKKGYIYNMMIWYSISHGCPDWECKPSLKKYLEEK